MVVLMGKRLYSDIEIGGVTYADANAAAAALGVTAGQVRMAVRKDRLDSFGTRPAYRSVTIRGVTYANFSEAGRALGVHANTVRAAYRNGTLHRVGTGRVGPEPMRLQIAGRVFENVHDAAKHFRCCPHTIWSALADGDPDRVARPQRYNPWKSKPFEIGGLRFPSMRAASRALGFKDEEFIAKAIKRKSKRGRERILAAAMAYADSGAVRPKHGGSAP
jgi:hypothetical protein